MVPLHSVREFEIQDVYDVWKRTPTDQIKTLPKERPAFLRALASNLAISQNAPLTETEILRFINRKWSKETKIAIPFMAAASILLIGTIFVGLSFGNSHVAQAIHFNALNFSPLGLSLGVAGLTGLTLAAFIGGYEFHKAAKRRGKVEEFEKFLHNQAVTAHTFGKLLNKGLNAKLLPPIQPSAESPDPALAPPIHKILPGLYLGSQFAAGIIFPIDPESVRQKAFADLRSKNITHIFRCIGDIKDARERCANVNYHSVLIDDNAGNENIAQHFNASFEFIESARIQGGALVHCNAGVSRSASIVIAYLMRKHELSYQQAFDFVRAKRACADPRPLFVDQLKAYELQLGTSRA